MINFGWVTKTTRNLDPRLDFHDEVSLRGEIRGTG